MTSAGLGEELFHGEWKELGKAKSILLLSALSVLVVLVAARSAGLPLLPSIFLFPPVAVFLILSLLHFEIGYLWGLFFVPLMQINLEIGWAGKTMNYDKAYLLGGIACWLVHILRGRRLALSRPAKILCVAWVTHLLAGGLTGLSLPSGRLEHAWFMLEKIFMFVFFLLSLDVVRRLNNPCLPAKVLLVSGNIVVVLSLAQALVWLAGAGKFWLFYPVGTTYYQPIFSTIAHPNFFAAFVNLIFPLTAATFMQDQALRPLWIRLMLLQLYFSSAARSLAGFGGTILNVLCITVLFPLRRGTKTFVLVLLILFMGISTWFWVVVDIRGSALGVRTYIARHSLDMARSAPLLGSGMGTFPSSFARYEQTHVPEAENPDWRRRGTPISAHNSFLLELVEGGVLGLATLLAVHLGIAWIIVRSIRGLQLDGALLAKATLAGFLTFWLHSLFEEVFSFSKLMILFVSLSAIFASGRELTDGLSLSSHRKDIGSEE